MLYSLNERYGIPVTPSKTPDTSAADGPLSATPTPQLERPDGHYQPQSFSSKSNLGYLLKRAWSVLAAAVDQEVAPYGITYPQFVILIRLNEGDCATAAELAREINTDTGAMTRMLDRLECKGIIRRVRSAQDRRVVNLEITPLGRDTLDKVVIVGINVLNRYFADFSADEVSLLEQMLRRVITLSDKP